MPIRFFTWLEAGERRLFSFAALAFGSLAAAALVARAAGTGLFVAAFGAERMPYLYLGSATFVFAAAGILVQLLARWPVELLLQRLSLAVLGLVIAIRAVDVFAPGPAAIAAFLAADLIAQLLVALFWALTSMLFDPRQSRRLLAPLGAAGTVACILAGAAVAPTAERIGTENLLWGVAALLAVTALVCREFVANSASGFKPGSLRAPNFLRSLAVRFQQPLAKSIAVLVALSAATLLIVDYVFVQRLSEETTRDGFAAYYGSLYSRANLGALGIQLFLAAPLLRLGGVQLGLAVLPGSLLLVATAAVFSGGFGWIALAKAHEPLFLFTMHALALQMLYHGVPLEVRNRVRTTVDGMVRPATLVVTGLALLLVGPRVGTQWLLAIVPVLTGVWLWSTRINVKRYLRSLLHSLQDRRLDAQETPMDAETLKVLGKRWSKAAPHERSYLLALVEELGATEIIPAIAEDMDDLGPDLQARALRLMEASEVEFALDSVENFARSDHSTVRQAALRLLLAREPQRVLKIDLDDNHESRAAQLVARLAAGSVDPTLSSPPSKPSKAQSEIEERRQERTPRR